MECEVLQTVRFILPIFEVSFETTNHVKVGPVAAGGQRATAPETAVLRAGTLDDAGDMRITTNIWTRSARPWAWIDPASRQFPGQPDATPANKS